MLTRFFYISEIVESVTDLDVQVILGAAQVNNRRLDVTGLLVQSDGYFAQVLEGRSEAMRPLVAKIQADRRHRAVRLLLEDPIDRRQFSRWAMGLVRRDDLSDELRRLHREGSESGAEVRRLIQELTAHDG